jgi:dTMP kinase
VLIDASADPGPVAANIWTALRDRLFAAKTGNAVNSA